MIVVINARKPTLYVKAILIYIYTQIRCIVQ